MPSLFALPSLYGGKIHRTTNRKAPSRVLVACISSLRCTRVVSVSAGTVTDGTRVCVCVRRGARTDEIWIFSSRRETSKK